MKYIYFAMDKEKTVIKIGSSVRPVARIRQLRFPKTSKFSMIGAFPGDTQREHQIQRRFRRFKTGKGQEWFTYSEVLLAFIGKRMIANVVDLPLPRGVIAAHPDTARVTFTVPALTRKALKREADRRGMKFSAFIEESLLKTALDSPLWPNAPNKPTAVDVPR